MSDFQFGEKPGPEGNPYNPPQGDYPRGTPPVASTSDERTWAMLCHLSTLCGYMIPFGNIIGPMVVWLVKKDESALVDDQGKEALNFQISVTIYSIICLVLIFVIIGIFLLIALVIFDLVVTIIAAIRSNQGEYYRYPMSIRFIT